MDGYSNLTKAIQDGVRIDWEQLDGRKAKCVHHELGILTYKFERCTSCDLDVPDGWGKPYSFQEAWVEAFTHGWRGAKGWSLWVEGEMPVKPRTAEELKPGTFFKGRCASRNATYFAFIDHEGAKNAYHMTWGASCDPTEIEVLEVYGIGTLQAFQGGSVSHDPKGALPKLTPEGLHIGETLIPSDIMLAPGEMKYDHADQVTTLTVEIAVDSARYVDNKGIYFNPYNAAAHKANAYEAGWRAHQEYEALNKLRADSGKDPLPKPPNPYL